MAVAGILTIVSGGLAAPLIGIGFGMNITSGVGGAIARKREQKQKLSQIEKAKEAIDADHEAMTNLEEEIAKLRENKTFVDTICDDVSFSRLNTGYNSELIFNLVVGRTVGSAVFQEEKEFDVDNMDEIKKDKKEVSNDL